MLEVKEHGVWWNFGNTATMYRAAVEFLAVTMIAEAAQPSYYLKERFLGKLSEFIDTRRRFPEKEDMPHLAGFKITQTKYLKDGRTPVVDQRTIQLLQEMSLTGRRIKDEFTFENFPARGKKNKEGIDKDGTRYAREDAYINGERNLPAYAVRFLG